MAGTVRGDHTDTFLDDTNTLHSGSGAWGSGWNDLAATVNYLHANSPIGTYKKWIPLFPDKASNMSGAGNSWGGGDDRYIIVTADHGGMYWDLNKLIDTKIAGKTVRLKKIEFWVYDGNASVLTGTLELTRRETLATSINRSESSVASVTETGRVAQNGTVFSYTLSISHDMVDNYSYLIKFDNLDFGSANDHRILGGYIEYEVIAN